MNFFIFINFIITSIDQKLSKIPRKVDKHEKLCERNEKKLSTANLPKIQYDLHSSCLEDLDLKNRTKKKSCLKSVINHNIKVGEMSLKEMLQINDEEIEALQNYKESLRVRDLIEKQELEEFEQLEKQIEAEEKEIKKITSLKCRRFNYEIDLQFNDLISDLPGDNKKTKEKFDNCLDTFLKIFSLSTCDKENLLCFRKALDITLKNVLIEYSDFLMKTMRYNYEIRNLLFLIKRDLSSNRDLISKLLYDTANSLEKKSDYNFILYLYSCCIKQYSQMDNDSERLSIFISLYLFFVKYIPGKKEIFRLQISENRYARFCNNKIQFISSMMSDIKNIGKIEFNNPTEKFCKNLAERYKKSDELASLFYESWSDIFSFISELSSRRKYN